MTLNVISASLYWIRYCIGKQCNLANIGIICSLLRVRVTIRAIEFCTGEAFIYWSPISTELQYSSLPATAAVAIDLAMSSDIHFRMCRSEWRWNEEDLQTLLTCWLKDSVSSIVTPRLLMLYETGMLTVQMSTAVIGSSTRYCALVLTTISSVLSRFKDIPFMLSQRRTAWKQSVRFGTVLTSLNAT